ncbi:MAG TPA: NUDIX hydrolase [Rhabdochlamydiaceae bacterium]|jgi:ADP-ribose pyrophosphatase|nr:NUDIX hydrolase [Rhabdochlamydiaceae bacterium]
MGKNADAHVLVEKNAKIDSRLAYEGKYLKVRHDTIHIPHHPEINWDIVLLRGAVAVIPIDSQGRIVLVEQWRRAIEKITLELPAGMLDPGESPEACAQRELQEETGFKAGSLKSIGGCYTSPGLIYEYIHLYLGKELSNSPLKADDTDLIDIRTIFVDEALQLIANGQISDAKTIIGILRYAYG